MNNWHTQHPVLNWLIIILCMFLIYIIKLLHEKVNEGVDRALDEFGTFSSRLRKNNEKTNDKGIREEIIYE